MSVVSTTSELPVSTPLASAMVKLGVVMVPTLAKLDCVLPPTVTPTMSAVLPEDPSHGRDSLSATVPLHVSAEQLTSLTVAPLMTLVVHVVSVLAPRQIWTTLHSSTAENLDPLTANSDAQTDTSAVALFTTAAAIVAKVPTVTTSVLPPSVNCAVSVLLAPLFCSAIAQSIPSCKPAVTVHESAVQPSAAARDCRTGSVALLGSQERLELTPNSTL